MAVDNKNMLIRIDVDDDSGAPVIKRNTKAINKLDKQVTRADRSYKSFGKRTQGLRDGTKGANTALMNTGRVLQDLPYGIRGVANNIDPLIESMQQVRRNTGSWRTALRAVGASLLGPSGIAIAVSAVTSAMVAFGPQIAEFFGIFDDGKESVEDAASEIDTFLGQKAERLIKELGKLDKFQSTNPFDTGKLQAQIGQLRAVLDSIPKFTAANAEELRKLNERIKSAYIDPNSPMGEDAAQRLVELTAEEQRRREQLLTLQEKSKQFSEERAEVLGKINEMATETALLEQLGQSDAGRQIIEEIGREMATEARSGIENKVPTAELFDTDLGDLTEGLKLDLGNEAGVLGSNRLVSELKQLGFTYDELRDKTVAWGESTLFAARQNREMSRVVEQQTVSAFSTLGSTIGQMSATEFSGQQFFESFSTLLAGFMQQFGEQLIALGVAKVGLDNLFAAGPAGGPLAIAAGTALVAAANAVRASASDRLGQITGANQTRQAIVGYRGIEGPQQSDTRSQFPKRMTVRFEDGTGAIVASGLAELDRDPGGRYVGG